jgi:hypothetical protein
VEGIRRELRGVAVARVETAELGGDLLGVDPGRLQHRAALGKLGGRRGRRRGRRAALGVEADPLEAPRLRQHRDPDQVAAGSAAGGPGMRPLRGRAAPRLVAQVVIDGL